ncbi:acetolactate synthase [Staphylococcus xylosus]|uniref:thiamine pyrophosphate-dependent enzyme n=1 Tax=Staphylococcus xylosus TaxID=1288 RepID=UPI000D1D2F71|nr:thiamine pyrophosphate-dependent enzyme [Staphylococcus xylosus]PTH97219.1 acetolactate synthase [Staphylococcus xylosus]
MVQSNTKIKNKHGGQAIVEVLKKEGVKKIFGVPGESYLNVLDALYEENEIDFISARQEGGASFMAESYAKASGDVGVCSATRGPGATNLSIGLHTAQQDSTPLVALIGQVERPFKNREAFQEIDFNSFFNDICKWTIEIDDANRIPEILHRAFHVARSGRPGPVLVSLPEDMQNDIVNNDTHGPIKVPKTCTDSDVIQEVAKELKQAKKPVIIAGGGVILSNATKDLVTLSETIQAPVATAFRRFHAFPNSHPNYIGALGLGACKEISEYIQDSDLVLALGTKFSQMTTNDYSLINEQRSDLIHVDISPESIGRVYTPTIPVVSDVRSFIVDLLKVVDQEESDVRQSNLKEANEKYKEFSTPTLKGNKAYANMTSVIDFIQKELPKDTIITSDSGNFFSWISRYYKYDNGGKYFGPTSGAMGYGMPAAIGAKFFYPNKTVISISGDGGFMMTPQEFETAVRYEIPIISIVINNNMYGTIHAHQEAKFPNRVIGTTLTNMNFSEYAKNLGGHGERVEKNEEIPKAFERVIESGLPAIIEVMTDPTILSAKEE